MSLLSGPKIGLALGGGGARGLAHIGVIKTLEKYKIPIDFIAGTSAGSLVGGMYAATGDIKRIENLANEVTYNDFLKAFWDPSLISGLLKGKRTREFIEDKVGDIKIEDTKIPFVAVATDLISAKTVTLKRGSLSKAIMASCSIPGLFQPVEWKEYLLIDGGSTQQVPAQVAKDMGADKVIAVNLNPTHFFDKKSLSKKISAVNILITSFNIMMKRIAKENSKAADLVIKPDVPYVPLTKLVNGQELIKIGEKAAEKRLEDLKWLTKKKFLGIPYT
jgi:NTE family protein